MVTACNGRTVATGSWNCSYACSDKPRNKPLSSRQPCTHVCLLLTTFLRSNSVSCPLTCSMAAALPRAPALRAQAVKERVVGGRRGASAAEGLGSSCGARGAADTRPSHPPGRPGGCHGSKAAHSLAGNNGPAAAVGEGGWQAIGSTREHSGATVRGGSPGGLACRRCRHRAKRVALAPQHRSRLLLFSVLTPSTLLSKA